MVTNVMATSGASDMSCKPSINAFDMKGVSTIIKNTHALALLNRVLTDGTIVIHVTSGSCSDGMLINLFFCRMNSDGLIEKVLKRGCFKHLPDKAGKKGVCCRVSSHKGAARRGTRGS